MKFFDINYVPLTKCYDGELVFQCGETLSHIWVTDLKCTACEDWRLVIAFYAPHNKSDLAQMISLEPRQPVLAIKKKKKNTNRLNNFR